MWWYLLEATVAEESVRLLWACKRLLNGRKRAERSIALLKNIFVFIEFRGSSLRIYVNSKNKASCRGITLNKIEMDNIAVIP